MNLHHPDSREAQRAEATADYVSVMADQIAQDGYADVAGPDGWTTITLEDVIGASTSAIAKAYSEMPAGDFASLGKAVHGLIEANSTLMVKQAMGVIR